MSRARAVAYIRVSTANDAQLHSYEFQENYWRSAFENDPETELIGIYADKGISGHSISKRPQFLAMMEDARQHRFDKIYTKSVSRFSRDTKELLEAVRELRDIGVEVVFENENVHTFEPTSEIFLSLAATIAENELRVDSERQRWSIQHRYQNGYISVGSGLYGFRMNKDNELVIEPEEADVVRWIFNAYVNEHLGSVKIADALNKADIPTRTGKPWLAQHIIGMLRNEKYKGDAIMGKKVQHLGEYKRNRHGEHAPRYYLTGSHEGIISSEIWDAAQGIMDMRGKKFDHTYVRHDFTGMIECACCGKNYAHKILDSGTKYHTDGWACRTALKNGVKACDNSRIKDSVLKAMFVEAYNEFIRKRPEGDSMIAMQEVFADLRQQENELAELYMQRLLTKAAYEEERSSIKIQLATIKKKMEEHRRNRIPETEHVPIKAFDPDIAKRFITKVIVEHFTVTFVFYNGARITKRYSNGQTGNKRGWLGERKDA
jgi:DNA invertase Pin-like site-specific DNA recombinase